MSLIKLFYAVFIACFVSVFLPDGEASAQSDVEELRKSVVQVFNFGSKGLQGSGTGFVVSNEGHIVTNNHVTSGGVKFLVVRNNTLEVLEAELINTSREVDVSILRAPKLAGRVPRLTLNLKQSSSGSTVYAIGYPGAANSVKSIEKKAISTTTKGIVSRIYNGTWGKGGTALIVQHSAQINGGNSGGPLFNDCNQVIGVNTAGAAVRVRGNKIDAPQGVFYASHISEAIRLLENSGATVSRVNQDCSSVSGAVRRSGPSSASIQNDKKIKDLEAKLKEGEKQRAEEARLQKIADELRIAKEKERQTRIYTGIGIAIGGLALLCIGTILFAMRRPKHPFVRTMSQLVGMPVPVNGGSQGRSGRGKAEPAKQTNYVARGGAENTSVAHAKPLSRRQKPSKRDGIVLSGFDAQGNTIRHPLGTSESSGKHGISFGRSPDFCDKTIYCSGVSKRQFRVSFEGGSFYIEDLNSTNGTAVNGRFLSPYSQTRLKIGDKVTVGDLNLDVSKR